MSIVPLETLQLHSKTKTLLDVYHGLSPLEKDVLQAYAVAFGSYFHKSSFCEHAYRLGIRQDRGKKLTTSMLDVVADHLRVKKLLDQGSSVNPAIQHYVLLEALQGPKRDRIIEAYGIAGSGMNWLIGYGEEGKIRKIAIQIYLLERDDENAANRLCEEPLLAETLVRHFIKNALDIEWVKLLPLAMQCALFERRLWVHWNSTSYPTEIPNILHCIESMKKNQGLKNGQNCFYGMLCIVLIWR